MKFSILVASFAAIASAAPLDRRAVFQTSTFDSLSISGGTAGNAKQEALDVLGGLPTDLSTVEKADLTFLDDVNGIANDAEKGAFNPAIEAATGAEADALQVRLTSSLSWQSSLYRTTLTVMYIARKDQEQGPQVDRHCSQAASPGRAGPRHCC